MNLLAILVTQSENSITRAISGPVHQWSLTFLAPETGFVKDNLSTDGGRGEGQGDGAGCSESDGEQWEKQVKLCSLACRSPSTVQPRS